MNHTHPTPKPAGSHRQRVTRFAKQSLLPLATHAIPERLMSISSDIMLELCVETAQVRQLGQSDRGTRGTSVASVFPRYRSGQQRARISEQEARQVYAPRFDRQT